MKQTVLILGGRGRFGRNAAQAFGAAGWAVHHFNRDKDTLVDAARGVDVIVNGWNPPYSRWASEVPMLTADVIAASKASGATVMIPGNIYVYGRSMPKTLGPDTPHQAENPLGVIRRTMEDAYRQAGVRTVIIRAGDFLDTEASGNWFDLIIAKQINQGKFSYPGNPDIPHAWAWLPDLARCFVAVAEARETLPQFTDIPFPGYTLTGHELATLCAEATDRTVTLKKMQWLPIQVARPFWREAKHILEMRYLWNTPHQLDDAAFKRVCPGFTQTPVQEAVSRAVQSLVGSASAAQTHSAHA